MPETETAPLLRVDRKLHRYWRGEERLDSVTDILGDLGIIETEFFTEDARARGHAVHRACEFLDEGDLDWSSLAPIEKKICQPVAPYVRAWERFKRETGFVCKVIERPVYHSLYLYAGTPDRIGVFPNEKGEALLDLKTGEALDWAGLQTGGYDEALGKPQFGGWRRRYAVKLRADGDFRLVPFEDVNDGKTFLSMFVTHRWGKNHGRYNRSKI